MGDGGCRGRGGLAFVPVAAKLWPVETKGQESVDAQPASAAQGEEDAGEDDGPGVEDDVEAGGGLEGVEAFVGAESGEEGEDGGECGDGAREEADGEEDGQADLQPAQADDQQGGEGAVEHFEAGVADEEVESGGAGSVDEEVGCDDETEEDG